MKTLIAILALVASAYGQGTLQRIQRFCEDGNQAVVTQGLNSTTKVQRSFPQCTVAVYLSGTSTLATIFSDNLLSPTPLANPFTANTDGSFGLYAAPAACYDVVTSGAGFPSPFTYAYICLGTGSSGSGVNPGTPYQVTRYDPTGQNIQNSSGSDNPANTFTQWPNGLTVMGNALGLIYPNSPNGTAIQLLACIDPTVTSVSEITTCPAGTNKAVGLVHFGGGISGNAQVSQIGFDTCIFDGQTVIGDYAGPSSTTAGACADIGTSPSAAFQRIGRITTLNSGNGTASTMQLGPWDLFAPGGGGGSGIVGVCNTANSNAVFVLAGNKVDCDPFVTDIAGAMTMFSLGLIDPNHAGFYYQKQGPQPPTTPANSVAEYPPTSVTAYAEKRPGVVGTVGQARVISSIGTDGGGNPIAIEGWGATGGSVELQTNGVDNANCVAGACPLLDLVAGSNITLTNTSAGHVSIAAAAAGGGASKIPFDSCNADQTITPGNAYWRTVTYTAVAGVASADIATWEYSVNVAGTVICKLEVPSNASGTIHVFLDLASDDTAAGHTAAFKVCYGFSASQNIDGISYTCTATQNYTSTATAYANTRLDFTAASGTVGEYFVANVIQNSGGTNVNPVRMVAKVKVF